MDTKKRNRTALYMRVSKNDQNIEMQRTALKQYAENRGLTITAEFSDEGISGTKKARPGLDALMAATRNYEFDMILVFRFDRFARSTSHLVQALDEFNRLDVGFVSIKETLDTTTPMGRAMFTVISAMAQLERDIIIERVNAGIANARKNGVKLGAPVKINYDEIARLRKKGLSIRQISNAMKCGVATVHRIINKINSAS